MKRTRVPLRKRHPSRHELTPPAVLDREVLKSGGSSELCQFPIGVEVAPARQRLRCRRGSPQLGCGRVDGQPPTGRSTRQLSPRNPGARSPAMPPGPHRSGRDERAGALDPSIGPDRPWSCEEASHLISPPRNPATPPPAVPASHPATGGGWPVVSGELGPAGSW